MRSLSIDRTFIFKWPVQSSHIQYDFASCIISKITWQTYSLLELLLSFSGCHPREVEVTSGDVGNQDAGARVSRRKRQLFNQPQIGLEDFFVSCMQSYRRFRQMDIRTITSFTIDQTQWFESTDQTYCAWENSTSNVLQPFTQRIVFKFQIWHGGLLA